MLLLLDKYLSRSTSSGRRALIIAADYVAFVGALWSAYALRLSDWYPVEYLVPAVWLFVVVPSLGVGVMLALGLYKAVLRYMSMRVLKSVAIGVGLLVLILYACALLMAIEPFPRSVPIIFGMAAWLYVGGSRLIIRSYYQWILNQDSDRKRVLIYGAGSAGAQLAVSIQSGKEYTAVAFVDDDPQLHGRLIGQLRVHDPLEMPNLIEQYQVSHLLLAIPSASREQLNRVIDRLNGLAVTIRTMPSAAELISGIAPDSLRSLALEDLLGRQPVPPVESLVEASLLDKSVLVTGAGGSIGSELARQALLSGATTLVLYELSEFALYSIHQELESRKGEQDIKLIPVLGSVLDFGRLRDVMQRYAVQTVYHAAAYKHVPLVEHNVLQGIQNNSLGTRSAALAALEASVERFVLISTDKAVRPTNVMGASKRLAELFVQEIAQQSQHTVFSMVRFGNVLGSSGSVIPVFQRQVSSGGPVTVTHPDVTRYFMTIPEAASLVIQAGSMAQGGEVFVLDMGEPVKISELAKNVISLSGRTLRSIESPAGDIEIVYTGLRPGEKLFEELLIGDNVSPSQHPKIMCAQEACLSAEFLQTTHQRLLDCIGANKPRLARQLLAECVDGYTPAASQYDWLDD